MRKLGQTQQRGESDSRIIRLGESTKVRVLDTDAVAEWRQHFIQSPNDTEKFAYVTCPGRSVCPLCKKPSDPQGEQYFPISTRYAMNVWNYEEEAVKILIVGPQVQRVFDADHAEGLDVGAYDYVIRKSGSGIQTKYSVVRLDKEPFSRQVSPDDMHDLAPFEVPDSVESIFEKLEALGIDYDVLEVPSFTEDEALAFVLPYGKHKGLSVGEILKNDAKYARFLHDAKSDQGAYGDVVYIALHVALEARGEIQEEAEVQRATQVLDRESTPDTSSEPSEATGLIEMAGPGGVTVQVPEDQVEAMESAGFERVEAQPSVREDTPVAVKVAGVETQMPFGKAAELAQAGAVEVEFLDEDVNALYNESLPFNRGVSAKHETPEQSVKSVTSEKEAMEKPFQDPVTGKRYKTQGALTAAINKRKKEAGGDEPQATNGGPQDGDSKDDAFQRVKDLLRDFPALVNDHDALIKLFDETAGKRNISEFTHDELVKLEGKLQEMKS